jgi:hypothetical protein
MPEDGEAWRLSLVALDVDADTWYGRGFAECGGLTRSS